MLCGKNRVEEEVVRAVKAPSWTESWHPMPYATLLDAMEVVVANQNLPVVDRGYCLTKDNTTGELGKRMFGVWEIGRGNDASNWALGFRSSINKSLAAQFIAGNRVFVCDNLAFSGYGPGGRTSRKHTSGMNDFELTILVERTVKTLGDRMDAFFEFHENLTGYRIDEDMFKVLLVNSIVKGAIPRSDLLRMIDAYEKENDGSLYGFHGAATNVMRGQAIDTVIDKSSDLNRFLVTTIKERFSKDDAEHWESRLVPGVIDLN